MTTKAVVFDVVGTCFSYDNGRDALQTRLGDKLAKLGIPAKLLMYAWVTASERDYTYLSLISKYKPFIEIMRHSLTRLFYQAGVPDWQTFCTEEDLEYIVSEYLQLKPRDGLAEMLHILRSNGFQVYCCTDADIPRVKGYFDQAGVEMPVESILSADDVGVGKPEAAVYTTAKAKAKADVNIFAASHAWDVAAARTAGFHTVYCTTYEGDPVEYLYGKMDVVVHDLVALANAIVEKWGGDK